MNKTSILVSSVGSFFSYDSDILILRIVAEQLPALIGNVSTVSIRKGNVLLLEARYMQLMMAAPTPHTVCVCVCVCVWPFKRLEVVSALLWGHAFT